ncbi:nitrate assimilation regulatory protein nirA [Sarocladium implicatum]|nr:nitrate assimilation regulatory protein nirA [Sarocladium implicatum]
MSTPPRQLRRLLPQASNSSLRNVEHVPASQSILLPPKRVAVSNACNSKLGGSLPRPGTKTKLTQFRLQGAKPVARRMLTNVEQCDGSKPRCNQCVAKDLQCIFTGPRPNVRRMKNYKILLEILQSGPSPESDEALRLIRTADDVDAALDSVADAQLLLAVASTGAGAHSAYGFTGIKRRRLKSPRYMSDLHDRDINHNVLVDVPGRTLPLSRWTNVSADNAYLNHLVTLAFTWDNAVEHVFYQPMFEEDVAALDPDTAGSRPDSFCSRLLINSLLQLYTHDPATFKTAENSLSRGRLWADEAELLLQEATQPSITMLQGIYILFIYEGNFGLGTKAIQYFHRAIAVFRELNDERVLQTYSAAGDPRSRRVMQAMSWCLWGIYCLEWFVPISPYSSGACLPMKGDLQKHSASRNRLANRISRSYGVILPFHCVK